MKLDAIKLLR